MLHVLLDALLAILPPQMDNAEPTVKSSEFLHTPAYAFAYISSCLYALLCACLRALLLTSYFIPHPSALRVTDAMLHCRLRQLQCMHVGICGTIQTRSVLKRWSTMHRLSAAIIHMSFLIAQNLRQMPCCIAGCGNHRTLPIVVQMMHDGQ